MSIYNEKGKAYRITGNVLGVPNSRRIKPTVSGSKRSGLASFTYDTGFNHSTSTSRTIKAPKKLRSSKRRGR